MNKIALCNKCKKRKFDSKQGIVCSLTNEKPSFENDCPDFEKDETVKEFSGLDLKSNEQRAKVALVLIWVVLGLEILSLISSGIQLNLLQIISNGGEISEDTANANYLREQFIAIIYLIAYIVSGITFIMWFRRAYFNLHQKVENLSFSEGWAAGSWFVPIINLYRPYQIMRELYQETKKLLLSEELIIEDSFSSKLLGLWWALWIIGNIVGRIAFKFPNETVDELIGGTIISMIASIIVIPLALITIKVIKDYSKVESLLKH